MQFRIFGVWRLFAAFMVMGYHFSHYGPQGFEDVLRWYERLMPLLDVFFMISGFLIFARYSDKITSVPAYGSYLFRRLARLYPLHIMTTGFFVLVGLAVSSGLIQSHGSLGGHERYDWSQLPSNIFLIQAWGVSDALTFNYVSWSLSAEWFCYLALPIIALFNRKAGMTGLFLLLALAVTTLQYLALSKQFPYDAWMHASTWGAYRAFADFTIGAIVSKYVARSKWALKSPLPAWFTMIGACFGMQYGVPPYLSLTLLAFGLFLAAISERNAPERSAWLDAFAPLSNVSFGIYLWHPIFEAIMISFLWRRLVEPTGLVSFYPFLLVPMLMSAVTAMLSYRFIEKPIANWLLKKPAKPMGQPNQLVSVAPAE